MTTKDEVYNYIEEYIEEHRIPPSRRDIASGLGLTVSNVQFHIDSLVELGMLKRIPNTARGLVLDES